MHNACYRITLSHPSVFLLFSDCHVLDIDITLSTTAYIITMTTHTLTTNIEALTSPRLFLRNLPISPYFMTRTWRRSPRVVPVDDDSISTAPLLTNSNESLESEELSVSKLPKTNIRHLFSQKSINKYSEIPDSSTAPCSLRSFRDLANHDVNYNSCNNHVQRNISERLCSSFLNTDVNYEQFTDDKTVKELICKEILRINQNVSHIVTPRKDKIKTNKSKSRCGGSKYRHRSLSLSRNKTRRSRYDILDNSSLVSAATACPTNCSDETSNTYLNNWDTASRSATKNSKEYFNDGVKKEENYKLPAINQSLKNIDTNAKSFNKSEGLHDILYDELTDKCPLLQLDKPLLRPLSGNNRPRYETSIATANQSSNDNPNHNLHQSDFKRKTFTGESMKVGSPSRDQGAIYYEPDSKSLTEPINLTLLQKSLIKVRLKQHKRYIISQLRRNQLLNNQELNKNYLLNDTQIEYSSIHEQGRSTLEFVPINYIYSTDISPVTVSPKKNSKKGKNINKCSHCVEKHRQNKLLKKYSQFDVENTTAFQSHFQYLNNCISNLHKEVDVNKWNDVEVFDGNKCHNDLLPSKVKSCGFCTTKIRKQPKRKVRTNPSKIIETKNKPETTKVLQNVSEVLNNMLENENRNFYKENMENFNPNHSQVLDNNTNVIDSNCLWTKLAAPSAKVRHHAEIAKTIRNLLKEYSKSTGNFPPISITADGTTLSWRDDGSPGEGVDKVYPNQSAVLADTKQKFVLYTI